MLCLPAPDAAPKTQTVLKSLLGSPFGCKCCQILTPPSHAEPKRSFCVFKNLGDGQCPAHCLQQSQAKHLVSQAPGQRQNNVKKSSARTMPVCFPSSTQVPSMSWELQVRGDGQLASGCRSEPCKMAWLFTTSAWPAGRKRSGCCCCAVGLGHGVGLKLQNHRKPLLPGMCNSFFTSRQRGEDVALPDDDVAFIILLQFCPAVLAVHDCLPNLDIRLDPLLAVLLLLASSNSDH